MDLASLIVLADLAGLVVYATPPWRAGAWLWMLTGRWAA